MIWLYLMLGTLGFGLFYYYFSSDSASKKRDNCLKIGGIALLFFIIAVGSKDPILPEAWKVPESLEWVVLGAGALIFLWKYYFNPLAKEVKSIEIKVGSIEANVGSIKADVESIKQDMKEMSKKIDDLTKGINDKIYQLRDDVSKLQGQGK